MVMPKRAKRSVNPELRKKVSKACEACKRRKVKCNGQQPCAYCWRKSAKCEYAGIDKRSLRRKLKDDTEEKPKKDWDEKSDLSPKTKPGSGQELNLSGEIIEEVAPLGQFAPDGINTLSPLSSSNGSELAAELQKDENPYENGKSTRFLTNYAGNARFFGESNPLSLLQECRIVFMAIQGPSHFVSDPKIGMVHDEPDRIRRQYPVQVPSREVTSKLLKLFKENINDIYYVFDMAYFEENIVGAFYRNPSGIPPEKICLLYLVLAIGMLFAETSQLVQIEEISEMDPSYFYDSAIIVQRTLDYDGLLWQVEANLLIHFYYQAQPKRTLSWLHLGVAIRLAQGIGLHRRVVNEKYMSARYNTHRRRLWMTLFICDRVSSINLGRPLGINEYEWDDLGTIVSLKDPVENLRLRCQYALSQISAINGKIVENIYHDSSIRLRGAIELANELKVWSSNLPEDLNLKTTFHKITQQDDYNLSYSLVLLHLSQFSGIMLLCKPFFMHVCIRRLKLIEVSDKKNDEFYSNFKNAAIKAAFLSINLISKYVDHNSERLESFATIYGCFFASLILAFTLFEQTRLKSSNKEYIKTLTSAVNRGKTILYDYGDFNATSERWSENLENMLIAIFNDQSGSPSVASSLDDFDMFKEEIVNMNLAENGPQEESINFQETFVPTTFGAITDDDLITANMENPQFLDIFMYK